MRRWRLVPVAPDAAPKPGMSQIINLNKVRKQKARAAAEQQAAENRVRFGRTQEQKQRDAAEQAEAQRRLDQLRRDPRSESSEDSTP